MNGELRQDAKTDDLIFDCFAQVEHLSTAFTLEPGDVISTGTPAGVGIAMKPPRLLRAGDVVRIEIEGIGVLENPVVDEPGDTRQGSTDAGRRGPRRVRPRPPLHAGQRAHVPRVDAHGAVVHRRRARGHPAAPRLRHRDPAARARPSAHRARRGDRVHQLPALAGLRAGHAPGPAAAPLAPTEGDRRRHRPWERWAPRSSPLLEST